MRYVLNNVAFFVTLGAFAVVLGIIFLTRLVSVANKKFLLREFFQGALLMVLTYCADFVFMTKPMTQGLWEFANMQGYWWGAFTVIMSHVFAFMALTGIFVALRAVPYIGKIIWWGIYLVATISFRAYYFVMKIYPSSQDLMNLFHTFHLHQH